ncbi:GCP3 [Scenedesmus sp. PABB004]|nr:GCP3 [Scenedesmus sp. PABB004]
MLGASGAPPRWRGGPGERAALLEELVAGLARGDASPPPTAAPGGADALLGYALRVADSGIAADAGGDPDVLFHALRQRLAAGQRPDDAARLAELYAQLCQQPGLTPRGRAAVLALLQQLADSGPGLPAGRSIAAYRPLQLPKVLPVRGLAAGAADAAQGSSDQAARGPRPKPLHDGALAHEQHAAAGSAGGAVKQAALVKDVLRAVQGFSGRYNSFAPGPPDPAAPGAGLRVAPQEELPLPAGARTLLHELGELGLMYRRVQAAIAEGRGRGRGSVHQALCAALGEEVTDFYRLMAVLQDQLAAPQPHAGGGGGDDASPARDAARPYLSLRRLQLWLAEPLRRMRLLAALVDGCRGRLGGDLAGAVWAASKVGDPLAASYATRILHQMCVPLFDMIRAWVFEGRLDDPACEFFVVPGGGGGGGDAWRDAVRLEPAKLPPFVGPGLAATILRSGKSINFLRDACGDGRWVQDWAPGAAAAAAALGYGQLAVLERAVVSAGRAVDARLMAVLHSSGELERHCQAIRRYLLLGQGDFVVALLDCLGPELAKPARDVSEVTLNHLLRQALAASAGGGRADEEGGAQERLRARKAPAGEGETGWDVFSLHYALGPPLSSIFTPAAQASYSRLSRLLWTLRRVERSLGSAWHVLKVEVERSLPRFGADPARPRLLGLLRACLRLRAEMAHLCVNLQYYVNLEVLECAWSEFVCAAGVAPDLDSLIAAHDRFLASVLQRALLGGGAAEALRPGLGQLLRTCMGLAPLAARFNERVQAGLMARERRAAEAAANTAAGRWGATSAAPAQAVPDDELGELADTLAHLADSYRTSLRAFLRALPAAANEVNAEVRFLLARLNFSDFYTRSAAGAASG